jgi:glycosyltransferase involved in cell wall biosynthesis
MLIAVNTRMLLPHRLEGIGYFCLEAFSRIVRNHPEHDFLFLFDRPFDQRYIFSPNVKGVVASPPARHPILWYLWYEYALPRIFKKYKPDLFVSPDGYASLASTVKTLTVIHDINFEHFPADLPFFNRSYYRHYFPKFAHHAHRIATVSEFSKKDIAGYYHVPEGKIDVVYNGVNEGFRPIASADVQQVRDAFTEGAPYFLFIGAIHKRKNIIHLLQSFDAFKTQSGSTMKLVFAGQKRWWTEDMESCYTSLRHKSDIIFTGRVEEETLHRLAAAAFAVTYVSNFEGFGIPILEGMRAGVPVLTSNVTSMPEVAGDAALLVDPFSTTSITEGMLQLYTDAALRSQLVEKGLQRSKLFSWENTANSLWESMMKTLK